MLTLIGESSAESLTEIDKILDGADLVFLTAGMGGVVLVLVLFLLLQKIKSRGIITVAIVTVPFLFEGRLRKLAEKNELRNKIFVNSPSMYSNDRLLKNSCSRYFNS